MVFIMAKLTKETVLKYNAGCCNSWRFDLMHSLIHGGEKQLKKQIRLENNRILDASLYFTESYDWKTKTEYKYITLHLADAYAENDMICSYGLGKFITCKQVNKKYLKDLQLYTSIFNDEKLIDLFNLLYPAPASKENWQDVFTECKSSYFTLEALEQILEEMKAGVSND